MTGRLDRASDSHARASHPACTQLSLATDPLSDVLRSVQLSAALYFVWNASWPYASSVPNGAAFAPIIMPGAQQIISYHVVTEGRCWGGLVGAPPVELRAGDILLVPHGDAYTIASSAAACRAGVTGDDALEFFRRMADGSLPFVVEEGGRGAGATHLVCGFLGCSVRPFNPVLAALPALVHVRSGSDSADRVRTLVEYTLAEARAPTPGAQSVLIRLSELMFVEVVRRYLASAPVAEHGWLAALRDPITGRALMLLHAEPAAPWTLDQLAARSGVSRSRLAEVFTRLVGEPPMHYLARWRVQLASRMLSASAAKIAAIARDVGYESEAAFSRAFKRLAGTSPSRWREEATAASHEPSRSNRATGRPRPAPARTRRRAR